MDPVLTLTDVCYGYGPVAVLDRVSLRVAPGEMVGLLGPNGSGKSTLLKVMDGILVPQQGQIQVQGTPIQSLSRSKLARKVAMVAQESHFGFSFSVAEVVLMGRFAHLRPLQFEGKRDMQVAFEALQATHCLQFAERSIHELSGGERQRVLIARALAQEAGILLLDEPTSFLDLKFKRELFELIQLLSKQRGLSVVIASHDIDPIANYCQKVIMMRRGAIYQQGEPARVVTASNVRAVYDCPVHVDRHPVTGRPRVSLL
jgi:iron complex transport system ATP-binding protein